jgi:hypothetical protein
MLSTTPGNKRQECPDGSDEEGCPCEAGEIKCPKSGICFKEYEWCPECCESEYFDDVACTSGYKPVSNGCELNYLPKM